MNEEEIVAIARKELVTPTLNITKQYLNAMNIAYQNDQPQVARIDYKDAPNNVCVYFKVSGERFFIVVKLSLGLNITLDWVWIESGNRAYFTVTSENLNFVQLSEHLKLNNLSGWSKGELRPNGKSAYNFSRVSFEPNINKAFELEDKLLELLNELEKDTSGVQKLASKAHAYVSICRNQYVSGNTGICLNHDIINRLQKLNLSIDIDTYISGNKIDD